MFFLYLIEYDVMTNWFWYFSNGNLSFLGKHEEGSLVGKLVYQIQFEMLDIIINGVFFSILNIFLFELLRFIKNR